MAHLRTATESSHASSFPSRWDPHANEATLAHASPSSFTISQSRLSVPDRLAKRRPDRKGPRDNLSIFCKNLPQTLEAWQTRSEALCLTTADGIRTALRTLVSSNPPASTSETSFDLTTFEKYLTEKRKRIIGGDEYRSACLSSFTDLIFLGECSVAAEFGVSTKLLDRAVSGYLSTTDSISRNVSQHYRKVPRKISEWMDKLYMTGGRVAFELFLHARRSISSYDALARSTNIDTAFFDQIHKMIPDELHKRHITDRALYLPFLVWASILVNVKKDCFDELCRTFPLANVTYNDFKRCLSFLTEGQPEISLTLAQSARNARSGTVDTTGPNTARLKRAAPSGPRRTHKRLRAGPPHGPVGPQYTAEGEMTATTERSASDDQNARNVSHQRPSTANVSHDAAQQFSVRDDNAVHLSPPQTAIFCSAMHCDLTSFAAGHEPPDCPPPEQFSCPPELPTQGPPQGCVYVAAGIDVPVASCNIGQLDNATVGLMGSVSFEGAVQAWTPESRCGPCPGGLGCSAAGAGSVGTIIHTGSGQIGGVELCVVL
ncbi:hypothetical protein CNYM01_13005 [Colletotrichum nymphaeae SA-01]|uniref:Uncharacterized protein n=1 Tax=Colletotrichum nymphaeae SA-01 TaxID=1460502 RepID=A0A135SAC8_9PEZI|nr:hypothetical protein CNYM01_13005 [Colletotrichum nymphaeae SA-01]